MGPLTVIGSNSADVFNPNVFGTDFSEYIINANGGDDVVTVTDSIPTTIFGGDGNDTITLFDTNDFANGGEGNDTISAGGGDDEVVGGAGDDVLNGEAGDDTISGGIGNDLIDGGEGNDFLSGGLGDDRIFGGNGNDIINAGNGDDDVFGGNGADILNGAGGNDYIDGGKGNDTIDGGSGDDYIFGRKGNNDLFGGAGNDTVNTGDHTSVADGGAGDDLMIARLKKGGDHTLTGGAGADVFEFQYQSNKKSSDLTITDFELGVDDFQFLNGLGAQDWVDTNFAFADTFGIDLLTEVDGNAVLEIGFNDTVTFEGVSEAEFMAFYVDDVLIVG